MKKLLLAIFCLISTFVQSQDLIILRNGETINCKITKIDSLNIYYNFQRGNREITSFIHKNEIKSYQLLSPSDSTSLQTDVLSQASRTEVVIDTSVYIKPSQKWVNLITYSQKFGIHAFGWTIQYYGYILKNDSKWIIPCQFGLESFKIDQEYFEESNYRSASMGYWIAGISPFLKLNNYFYVNLGLQIIMGSENLENFYGSTKTRFIFGIAPSQGVFFIPKSKFGVVLGIGVYEKLLSSDVYKNDLGIKFEIGLKF